MTKPAPPDGTDVDVLTDDVLTDDVLVGVDVVALVDVLVGVDVLALVDVLTVVGMLVVLGALDEAVVLGVMRLLVGVAVLDVAVVLGVMEVLVGGGVLDEALVGGAIDVLGAVDLVGRGGLVVVLGAGGRVGLTPALASWELTAGIRLMDGTMPADATPSVEPADAGRDSAAISAPVRTRTRRLARPPSEPIAALRVAGFEADTSGREATECDEDRWLRR